MTARRVLEAGLFVTILLLPLKGVPPLGVAGRVGLVAACVAGVFLYFRDRPKPAGLLAEAAFVVFVALSAASVLVSVDPGSSLRWASKVLLRQLVLFLLVAGLARERGLARPVTIALGLSGLLLALESAALWMVESRNVFGGLTGPGMDYNTCLLYTSPSPRD